MLHLFLIRITTTLAGDKTMFILIVPSLLTEKKFVKGRQPRERSEAERTIRQEKTLRRSGGRKKGREANEYRQGWLQTCHPFFQGGGRMVEG